MKCINHPEADATGYCRQCGKGLCADCRRDVRGVVYCEDCLAATMMRPQAAAPSGSNPGVALVLGFIPGVGAIYNGEYAKGFIYILIFGGLISLIDSPVASGLEPVLGLLMAGFIFYMIVDSYRTAKAKTTGQPLASSGWEGFGFGGGERTAPVGPLVLIVLGALFLMRSLDLFHWHWFNLGRFWPVLLIALGAYMLWKRTAGLEDGAADKEERR